MTALNTLTDAIYAISSVILFLALAYLAFTAPDFATMVTFIALAWIPGIAMNQVARDARERNANRGI